MRSLAGMLVLSAAASCPVPGGVQSEYVLTAPARPPYQGPVKVVLDGAPIEGTYTEIAIVSANGSGTDATLPAVLGKLQAQAAAIGANTVIRVRYDQGATNSAATGVAVWLDAADALDAGPGSALRPASPG